MENMKNNELVIKIGMDLAEKCEYIGEDIMKAAIIALKDSNFNQTANWLKIMLKLNDEELSGRVVNE